MWVLKYKYNIISYKKKLERCMHIFHDYRINKHKIFILCIANCKAPPKNIVKQYSSSSDRRELSHIYLPAKRMVTKDLTYVTHSITIQMENQIGYISFGMCASRFTSLNNKLHLIDNIAQSLALHTIQMHKNNAGAEGVGGSGW